MKEGRRKREPEKGRPIRRPPAAATATATIDTHKHTAQKCVYILSSPFLSLLCVCTHSCSTTEEEEEEEDRACLITLSSSSSPLFFYRDKKKKKREAAMLSKETTPRPVQYVQARHRPYCNGSRVRTCAAAAASRLLVLRVAAQASSSKFGVFVTASDCRVKAWSQ